MNDVQMSLRKAVLDFGWLYSEKLNRIGNPFVWVDGDNTPMLYTVDGVRSLLQFFSMFFEEYPLPKEYESDDYEEMVQYLTGLMTDAFNFFVPFTPNVEFDQEKHIRCTSVVRAQDYSAIKTLCKDLPESINHLDIGSGLGTHSAYSLKAFDAVFYSIEASPHTYGVQRNFYKFLSQGAGTYLDLVECENFNLDRKAIAELVNNDTERKYRIKHVPSWYFDVIADQSIDLVTASWVLNEVAIAGILWLMSQTSRVLKRGGYVYLRDSMKLKPLRHMINYDELLVKMGFAEVHKSNVVNRVDFYGIPRVYRKETDKSYTFEELVDSCLGHFAVTTHGGALVQNMPKEQPKELKLKKA